MKCNVILEFTVIEKLKVNTPWIIDWWEAVKKAEEKIRKKYKWKEINFIDSKREYEGL